MIRHIVLLTFNAETSDAHIDHIAQQLRELPGTVKPIKNYEVSRDLGRTAGNAGLAVVADFDDYDGYQAYADDPGHQALIAADIRPHLAGRTASQFEWTPEG